MIKELKGYRWGNNDLPVKRNDHSLDELRYFIMTRPHKDKPLKVLSDVAKDKQKLIRQARRYHSKLLFISACKIFL